MRTYVLRRLLQLVPLLLAIAVLTFLLLKLAGGSTLPDDPRVTPQMIEAMRHRFGLDRPWLVQLGMYLENLVLHFDLGESFSLQRPVAAVLGECVLNTLLLAGAGAVVTWALAIPLGVIAASRRNTAVDRGLSV